MAPPVNTNDTNNLTVEYLRRIHNQLSEQQAAFTDLRERIIRLETHGYSERISYLEKEVQALQSRVIVLETQGKFITAGVAAVVSAAVAFGTKILGATPH
jgi:hypothetical protein